MENNIALFPYKNEPYPDICKVKYYEYQFRGASKWGVRAKEKKIL